MGKQPRFQINSRNSHDNPSPTVIASETKQHLHRTAIGARQSLKRSGGVQVSRFHGFKSIQESNMNI